MIHTITLNPFVKKIIRGDIKDEIMYEPSVSTYTCGGIGLQVSTCLKAYHLDSQAHFITGSNIVSFIKEDLEAKGITYTYIETNTKAPILAQYHDEVKGCLLEDVEPCQIEDIHTILFTSLLQSKIKKEDVVVLEYNEEILSVETLRKMYSALYDTCEVMICDLHPTYYPILEEKQANVLLVEASALQKQMGGKKALSEVIETIQNKMTSLAKIIVYVVSANDFLLFFEGNVYRVVCTVKDPTKKVHKEAIIAGIIKCYLEDGDLKTLSEHCLSMSVGAGLSDGLYAPSEEVIQSLHSKIHMYTI